MKKKVFIVTLAGFIIIIALSMAAVVMELSSADDINLNGLTGNLYKENNLIMNTIIQTIPPSSYETLKLPPSWAEIMTVDAGSLVILNSTDKNSIGKYVYSKQGVLDQAKGILSRMKSGKPAVIQSKDYTVAIVPYQADTFIIGLKPKAWEKDLVNSQYADMQKASSSAFRKLLILAFIGILTAVIVSFYISSALTRYLAQLSASMKALSLGDMNAEPPVSRDKDLSVFSESFIRIRTSLDMALNRLKAK